jgi:competence protein ComGC
MFTLADILVVLVMGIIIGLFIYDLVLEIQEIREEGKA